MARFNYNYRITMGATGIHIATKNGKMNVDLTGMEEKELATIGANIAHMKKLERTDRHVFRMWWHEQLSKQEVRS